MLNNLLSILNNYFKFYKFRHTNHLNIFLSTNNYPIDDILLLIDNL